MLQAPPSWWMGACWRDFRRREEGGVKRGWRPRRSRQNARGGCAGRPLRQRTQALQSNRSWPWQGEVGARIYRLWQQSAWKDRPQAHKGCGNAAKPVCSRHGERPQDGAHPRGRMDRFLSQRDSATIPGSVFGGEGPGYGASGIILRPVMLLYERAVPCAARVKR